MRGSSPTDVIAFHAASKLRLADAPTYLGTKPLDTRRIVHPQSDMGIKFSSHAAIRRTAPRASRASPLHPPCPHALHLRHAERHRKIGGESKVPTAPILSEHHQSPPHSPTHSHSSHTRERCKHTAWDPLAPCYSHKPARHSEICGTAPPRPTSPDFLCCVCFTPSCPCLTRICLTLH